MTLPFEIDLKNKVVVITGAGGVICSHLAKAIAKCGAKVALLDLNKDNADVCAKEITNAGNCGEKGILLHCQRECKLVQSVWEIVWQFLKKLKIKITIWSSNTTSGYTYTENKVSKRCMYTHVHSSIIHNSQ